MTLCFTEPEDAIQAIASSIGEDSRRQLAVEVIRQWVDEVPEDELEHHYLRVVSEMDEEDLTMLAAWHMSLDVMIPVASRDILAGAFGSLGDHKRDALRIAAAFRSGDDVACDLDTDETLMSVLPILSQESIVELADVALEIYMWDRLGTEN